MISQLDRPTKDQTAHTDFAESLKQAVIEQTDNGRRIIQSVTSIMEGDAPNCTPWHQLEAAKLLHKLGLGNTRISSPLALRQRKQSPLHSQQPTIIPLSLRERAGVRVKILPILSIDVS